MSTEQPPITPEQLRVRRRKELAAEGYHARVKGELREIFQRHQTGPERIEEISDKLEPYFYLVSEEEKDRILNSLQESIDITDENEFAEQIFSIVKVIVDVRSDRLDLFENIQRKQYYENNPTYKELNQLFAYEIKGDEIHLHVPPNIGTSIKDTRRLLRDGLGKLAEIVKNNLDIEMVAGHSWIVGENPSLLKMLGFEVTDFEVAPDGKKNALATIRREELLKRYLKSQVEEKR